MSNVTELHNSSNKSPFHIGDRIRKVRELYGYGTRKGDFADLIDVDRGTLGKYESTGHVKQPVVHAIANATGARLEFLLHGTGPAFDPEDAESMRVMNRSLATVTRLQPRTPAKDRETLATVTHIGESA